MLAMLLIIRHCRQNQGKRLAVTSAGKCSQPNPSTYKKKRCKYSLNTFVSDCLEKILETPTTFSSDCLETILNHNLLLKSSQ